MQYALFMNESKKPLQIYLTQKERNFLKKLKEETGVSYSSSFRLMLLDKMKEANFS